MKRLLIVFVALVLVGGIALGFREGAKQDTPSFPNDTTAPTEFRDKTDLPVEEIPEPTVKLPYATMPDVSIPYESQPEIPVPTPIETEPEEEFM